MAAARVDRAKPRSATAPVPDGAARAAVAAALDRLRGRSPTTIDLSLDRVRLLLARLGDPQRHLAPVVHIAGTNGKGSTLAILRALLEASGRRVHAYTSPHLLRFNERIRVAGTAIGDAALLEVLERVETAIGSLPVTFFEATTCAAFLAFAETPADVVLLETGLGGRLDATNMIDRPAVTAITPIGFDHMAYLGDTLAAIAAEKAGILKAGVPAVIGPQPDAALTVLRTRAADLGVSVAQAGETWRVTDVGGGFVYDSMGRRLVLPPPALPGRHQLWNAGMAIALAEALGLDLPEATVAAGLSGVVWPGRLQRLGAGSVADRLPPGSEVWLDAAHNAEGAVQLAGFLAERPALPTVLVWGMYADKPAAAFLETLRPQLTRAYAVPVTGEMPAMPVVDLLAAARAAELPAAAADDLADAVAQLAAEGALTGPVRIVLAGSVALVGQTLAANAVPVL